MVVISLGRSDVLMTYQLTCIFDADALVNASGDEGMAEPVRSCSSNMSNLSPLLDHTLHSRVASESRSSVGHEQSSIALVALQVLPDIHCSYLREVEDTFLVSLTVANHALK